MITLHGLNVSAIGFLRTRTALIFALTFCLLSVTSSAERAAEDNSFPKFQEGVHYYEIFPTVDTNVEPGNVEVVEIFWYGCPHCYEFEEHLKSWQQNKPFNVTFIRMPAALNRNWLSHARAYYALEKVGVLDRIHSLFFDAIHVQGRRLRDVESMMRFLSQQGVDADEFKKAYYSPYVEKKVKNSDHLVRQYGSSSVPTVVVQGKYRATAGSAGGHERLIELLNWLVQREASLIATVRADAD